MTTSDRLIQAGFKPHPAGQWERAGCLMSAGDAMAFVNDDHTRRCAVCNYREVTDTSVCESCMADVRRKRPARV